MKHQTAVERPSDREVVVKRTFDAPARVVFDAWTKAEYFRQWWLPKSMAMTMVSCEMDVRVGGGYRLEIRHGDSEPMAFFGKYTEVMPPTRLVWTNDESEGGAITTVTLEEKDGKTHLVLRERYPSKDAMDKFGGMEQGLPEVFGQLDQFLPTWGGRGG